MYRSSELEHSLLTVVIHEQKYSHRVWDQIVLDTIQNRVCREKMDYHYANIRYSNCNILTGVPFL